MLCADALGTSISNNSINMMVISADTESTFEKDVFSGRIEKSMNPENAITTVKSNERKIFEGTAPQENVDGDAMTDGSINGTL